MRRHWQILRSQRRPALFLLSRLLMRTGLCRLFLIRQPGFVLRFHPSALSATLWMAPDDRHADADFMRAYLRPGDVVIDAGANIGSTALAAAAVVGARGRVFAFEPHPRTFRYLEGNIALNHATQVRAINLALEESGGTLRFSDRGSDDQHAVQTQGGIEVPVDRLDRVLAGERAIALLKIDVEGYERFVLGGAQGLLGATACVYFEADEAHFVRHGYTTADLLRFLREREFSILRLVEGRRVVPVPPGFAAMECENLVAVRSLEDFLRRTGFAR